MYVRAGIPIDAVMSEANAALVRNLMLYGISLAAAFFISWLIGKKYIIDRVLVLERSSQRLADGDLDTRIGHHIGGGELGKLGQAFDNMAQRLADHVQELQHKADEYHAIIQTTSDGFKISDNTGRILAANDSYCRMIGYTFNELTAMNIADIEAIENREMVAAHISKMVSAGSDSFTTKHRRKDGTEIDVEVTSTALRFHQPGTGLIVFKPLGPGAGALAANDRELATARLSFDPHLAALERMPQRVVEHNQQHLA